MELNGSGITPADDVRLDRQRARVWRLMRDGKARTLAEIAVSCGDPTPSVSARLRDLRKAKYGGHIVNKHHLGDGLWAYWVEVDS